MDWSLLTLALCLSMVRLSCPKAKLTKSRPRPFPKGQMPPPTPMPSTPAQMQAAPSLYNLLAMEGPNSICAGMKKNNKIAAAAATIY